MTFPVATLFKYLPKWLAHPCVFVTSLSWPWEKKKRYQTILYTLIPLTSGVPDTRVKNMRYPELVGGPGQQLTKE